MSDLNESQELTVDDLFVGLPRPATVGGIPYTAFVSEIVLVAMVFLGTGSPLWILAIVPSHAFLYLASATDPGRFDTWAMAARTYGKCLNRRFWGSTSYSPLSTQKHDT